MTMKLISIKDQVHAYYSGWTGQNFQQVSHVLAPEFCYRNKQLVIDNADDFINIFTLCTRQFRVVHFLKEIYRGNEGVVVTEIAIEGGKFISMAEYFHFKNEKIVEIIVVNDDPTVGILFQ